MKNCISICFLTLCGLVLTLGNVQASSLNHSGKLARLHGSSVSVITNKPVGEEVVVNESAPITDETEGQNETTADEIPEENHDSFESVCEENCEACHEPSCESWREDCGMTCRNHCCWGRRYWRRMMRTSCACDCQTWTSTSDCGCGM